MVEVVPDVEELGTGINQGKFDPKLLMFINPIFFFFYIAKSTTFP